MAHKYDSLQLSIVMLLLGVSIVLSIAGKGCPPKSRDTAVGSSIPSFRINAPSSLTVTGVSYSQINMTWQDNSNNEDGFEIESRQSGTNYSLLVTVAADTTSYSDSRLIPFTTYYYRIRALNTMGDRSLWSNEATIQTMGLLWSTVTAGGAHTHAVSTDGTVWSWGRNDVGQLGLDDTTYSSRFTPSLIESGFDWGVFENISEVNAGFFYSCALKSNGTIWSWGNNAYGQLGQGNTNSYDVPAQIGTDSNWFQLSAGESHTAGLKTNRTLWIWGSNNDGQLGDGTTNDRLTPIQIGTGTDWSIVRAGWASATGPGSIGYTIALKVNRTLWAWGNNDYGQLGDGTQIIRTTPREIGLDSDWNAVAAGRYHTIGLKTNGTLWAWGRNDSGQLGRGDTISPGQVGTNSDWLAVSEANLSTITAGGNHTLAIKSNRTLWAWGDNAYGQLGDGTIANRTTPRQVGTDANWLAVSGGLWHTLGLKSNGMLWAWGYNADGRLGLGDVIDRATPTLVGN